MKITNKPIFKFSKDADLQQCIIFCKRFANKNNCSVQIQFKDHTKVVNCDTDVVELWSSFFDKTFNKHIIID